MTTAVLLLPLLLLLLVVYMFCNIDYYVARDPLLEELRQQLSVLHPRFKDIQIFEGTRSYTINKSKSYICLKDEHGRYYNRNMLVYVICHEYAHVLCDEIGHTNKFFEIFQDLLNKAAAKGLYNPSIPPLRNYCGVE